MKKLLLFIFTLSLCSNLFAQDAKMRITVKVPNAEDEVYIVGNQKALGHWNPGAVKLEKTAEHERSIAVEVTYPVEFKFTKGSWASEGYTGDKFENPNIVITEPTEQAAYEVLGWYDDNRRSFTEHYIRANKGKYSFEVPEVQELMHIVMALTPTGKADTNMVNHEGEYYQKVMQTFKAFESDPLVLQIEERLSQNSYGDYATLKMDACGFYFDGDKIEQDSVYDKLSWGGVNKIEPLVAELERFAKASNFQNFYRSNQPYYSQLIQEMEAAIPIQKQWVWLEKNFDSKYDHYRITFSPLVNGSHSTNRFMQAGFNQTVMFIRGPITDPQYKKTVRNGLMELMVFTEIDHNYVNPLSDRYMDEIKTALPNLKAWATAEAIGYYPNEYAVFNEYMTWAVYSLYAKEKFKKKDFDAINDHIEKMMVERRGFVKYKEFNRELLAQYKKKGKGQGIEALYPSMLAWVRNHQ
ncbi:DUF4932 domain-containing protein [uncultured Pontibacter sp.]|uniref:DUF4932 domain-containing protein n=1 Tax=uncultured Pontibacter sp. TaxID=453356 RepID=UPI0026349B27|nr:DUF4932 domain-containing protein [uncultured Pontibacter sp.]